jgi:SAM-dependent methyltransferase
VYENPRFAAEESKQLYSGESYYVQMPGKEPNSGYENYFVQCTPALQSEYFDIVQRFARVKTGRFLDVGCGAGGVLGVAQSRGWEAFGQEISDWAVEQARKQGYEIINALLLEAQFPENHFDAVAMFDVLEHLPSPVDYIREVHRILKPGGVLVVETPNIGGFFARYLYKENSDLIKPRAHICLFTPQSARRLCGSVPFSEVRIETFPYCRQYSFEYLKGLIATRILPGRTPMQLTFNESLRILCWK